MPSSEGPSLFRRASGLSSRVQSLNVLTSKPQQRIKNLSMSCATDAHLFAEYDLDGNQKLEFDEFLAMQPKVVHSNFSVSQIRYWFDQADIDGNGSLSVNEFFWCVPLLGLLGVAFESHLLHAPARAQVVAWQRDQCGGEPSARSDFREV